MVGRYALNVRKNILNPKNTKEGIMEIAFILRAKQGYIYRYMVERNITAGALAKEIGIAQTLMGRIINFKWIPSTQKLKGRNLVHKRELIRKLEDYFHLPIEYLFPPELTEEIAAKLSKRHVKIEEVEVVSLNYAQVKNIAYVGGPDGLDKVFENIPAVLGTLHPREEKVVRLMYGIGSEERRKP